MNLLDLEGPKRRRQGFYWGCVIASVVVHGGFLAYVLANGGPLAQSRPSLTGVRIEVIGPKRFAALPRGDREKLNSEAVAEHMPTEARPDPVKSAQSDHDDARRDEANFGAKELAIQIDAPLPEDGAHVPKALPIPDRFGKRQSATDDPQANSTARARNGAGMSLPARRAPLIQAEASSSKRLVPGLLAEDSTTIPRELPPLKLLAAPETPARAPGAEERRALALDMGAQGSPVVAMLPKGAAGAMFAAPGAEDAQMLPEDRAAASAQAWPEPSAESLAVPPPVRRVAPLAARSPPTERGGAKRTVEKNTPSVAVTRKVDGFRARVFRHLAANRPAGAYGSGKVVVAFSLTQSGGLRSVRISRSSGSAALDQSVLQSVHRAEPFPKPPEGLKSAQLHFVIPFEFR